MNPRILNGSLISHQISLNGNNSNFFIPYPFLFALTISAATAQQFKISSPYYILPLRDEILRDNKKSSPCISEEAVGIALIEIQGEEKRYAFTLPGIVYLETSYISSDDRFAALQIDLGWRRVTPAYRLTVSRFSFPYTVLRVKVISLMPSPVLEMRMRLWSGTRPRQMPHGRSNGDASGSQPIVQRALSPKAIP